MFFKNNFINHEKKSIINNNDEIRNFFIDVKQSKFNCRRCYEKFLFNNKFYYYIKRCKQFIVVEIHVYIDFIIDNKFKIIRSSISTNFLIDVDFRS